MCVSVYIYLYICIGFPGGSEIKGSACNAGDPGSIPGSGRSPEEGNGSPLQYSGLENATDRRAWRAPARRVAELDTTAWLTLHSTSWTSSLLICSGSAFKD